MKEASYSPILRKSLRTSAAILRWHRHYTGYWGLCKISIDQVYLEMFTVHWFSKYQLRQLRARRALSLCNVYGDSTLLVLNWTSLNGDSALIALNWRLDVETVWTIPASYIWWWNMNVFILNFFHIFTQMILNDSILIKCPIVTQVTCCVNASCLYFLHILISSKIVIAAQRCSVENQKGAIAVQSQWQ